MTKFTERTHFFKYLDFQGGFITLASKKIRLSSPILFNDPFDFQFSLNLPITTDEMIQMVAKEAARDIINGNKLASPKLKHLENRIHAHAKVLRNKYSENELVDLLVKDKASLTKNLRDPNEVFNEKFQAYLRDQFVYCLTENFADVVMWSHYSKGHTGVVIRFECNAETDNFFRAAIPVRYLEDLPTLGTKERWNDPSLSIEEKVDGETIYYEAISSKSKAWSYEREHRLVVPLPEWISKTHAFLPFSQEDVSEVFLGCRMASEDSKLIIDLIRQQYPKTRISIAKKSLSAFALEFSEV
jgi:hypothetical protein